METPRRSARILRRTQVSLENGRGFSIIEKTVVDHGPYFKAYLYLLESLIPIVSWILSVVIYIFYTGAKYMRFIAFASIILGFYLKWTDVVGVFIGNSSENMDFISTNTIRLNANLQINDQSSMKPANTLSEFPQIIQTLELQSQIMEIRGKMDNLSLSLESIEKEKKEFYQESRMEFVNLTSSFRNDIKKCEILQEKVEIGLLENLLDSRVNYALKSRGAKIIKASSDYRMNFKSKWLKIMFPKVERISRNLVESILETKRNPGDCWAMNGASGFVAIKLSEKIIPETLVIQHASLNELSDFSTAPKQVQVYSMKTLIGNGTFDPKEQKLSVFHLKKVLEPIDSLKVHILSNWGNMDYTCIYQIQVLS